MICDDIIENKNTAGIVMNYIARIRFNTDDFWGVLEGRGLTPGVAIDRCLAGQHIFICSTPTSKNS